MMLKKFPKKNAHICLRHYPFRLLEDNLSIFALKKKKINKYHL